MGFLEAVMPLTRISDISRWAACEAWAMTGQEAGGDRTPVAAWVGTMAHRFLEDSSLSAFGIKQPERYSVAFDLVTPTPAVAISQAQDLAGAGRDLLKRYGLKIVDSEVPVEEGSYRGTIDLIVMDQKNRAGVLDFKTGRTIGTAWLQLAGYLHAWDGAQLSFAGIVHVPRSKKEPLGTINFRDPFQLVGAWKATTERIDEVSATGAPTYSPGTHCAYCPLKDCAVRTKVANE